MLHNEARELLVAGYEKTHDAQLIADAYSVSKRTVYRLAQRKRETGNVELRTSQRGGKAFTTYEGGTTGKRFVTYLREVLIPTLKKGDIVVMDNLRSHHVKEVEELLRQNDITPLYLPPYSPDLNPIEKMWSKMKSYLRKWKVRVKEALPAAVEAALSQVTHDDVLGWFQASNYCQ